MKKPKPQSTQAPSCTTFLHKAFSLFQHHSNFLNPTFLRKTNMVQRKKYTLMNRYNKIWTQIKAKTKPKAVAEKEEHSVFDKSEN
jgi:hypothetical protein